VISLWINLHNLLKREKQKRFILCFLCWIYAFSLVVESEKTLAWHILSFFYAFDVELIICNISWVIFLWGDLKMMWCTICQGF
jgi:hypothetical protein